MIRCRSKNSHITFGHKIVDFLTQIIFGERRPVFLGMGVGFAYNVFDFRSGESFLVFSAVATEAVQIRFAGFPAVFVREVAVG